jgi:hypothetical protein
MQVKNRSDFRHWFGESKVVSADGSPRIVFHGTLSSFKEFCAAKRNPELGFHFGTLRQAEFFAGWDKERRALTGSNIRPVYLQIENPLENDQEGGSDSYNEDSFVAFEPGQVRSVFY